MHSALEIEKIAIKYSDRSGMYPKCVKKIGFRQDEQDFSSIFAKFWTYLMIIQSLAA